ncbi:uncharacterized protein LOC112460408 isoform X2 [Temnothorax curvispinosus]|uniref:Uncharacterized protein LOC112460408 isoform X2 n=1 Tax=Temnothorax curvispinosus TaxID=300111 RepID=A0A6J1QET2_9HYME|nr:uncharacterized protein LOC112460408 isoform X2 [Temnothorax curvispinosus]
MFTYVKFEDGIKAIVDTKDIVDFNIKDIQYDKKYQVKWDDGHFYYGIIGRMQQKAILEETKEAVDVKIKCKRVEFSPLNLCISATEVESESDVDGKNSLKGDDIKNRIAAKIKKLDTALIQKNNSKKLSSNTNNGSHVNKTAKVKDHFLSKNVKKKGMLSKEDGKNEKQNQIKKSSVSVKDSSNNTLKQSISQIDKNKSDKQHELIKGMTDNHEQGEKRNDKVVLSNTEKVHDSKEKEMVSPAVITKSNLELGSTQCSQNSLIINDNFDTLHSCTNNEKSVCNDNNSKTIHKTQLENNFTELKKGSKDKLLKKCTDGTINRSQFDFGYKSKKGGISANKTGLDNTSNIINNLYSSSKVGKRGDKEVNRIENNEISDHTALEYKSNKNREFDKKIEKLQRMNEDLQRQNLKLKNGIKNKEQVINDLMNLNMQLQKKVISEYPKVHEKNEEIQIKVLSNFDELMRMVSEYFKRNPMTQQNQVGQLPVYLGYGVYICARQYDTVCVISKSLPQFVKNLAIAVFGIKTLQESSVTGITSNRNKNKVQTAPRPALDSTKLQAIRAAVKYYAMSEKGHDEVTADFQAQQVGTHIAHKIYELNNLPTRKKKKEEINPAELCDDPINVENTEPDDRNDRNTPENNNSSESSSHLETQADNNTSEEKSVYDESLDYNNKENEESSKFSEQEDERKESMQSSTYDTTDSSQDSADDIE